MTTLVEIDDVGLVGEAGAAGKLFVPVGGGAGTVGDGVAFAAGGLLQLVLVVEDGACTVVELGLGAAASAAACPRALDVVAGRSSVPLGVLLVFMMLF